MNKPVATLAIAAATSGMLFFHPVVAQNPPPASKTSQVEIIKGPALEISHDDLAIIRWFRCILSGMRIWREGG